jgi:TonB-linked SusC/RagA family outer membrane protein
MKQFYNRLNSGILRALQQAKRIHGGGGHLVFRTLLLALLLLSTPSLRVALRAQSRTMALSGIVLDENDAPMVGVSVVAAKSTIGTTTDTRGTFRLVVNTQCDSLHFSFVGYKPVTRSVRDIAMVRMQPDSHDIGQVVVTGIYTRKAESYTGAAKTITHNEIMRVGNQNLLQSLKNLDPTVYIPDNLTSGSDPNSVPTVSMRGTSSFPASESSTTFKSNYQNQPNQPLFILDGFETTVETVMDMDMNRIESMTILKDASAKALYGSKAANGVIVIETHHLNGDRPTVTYNGSISIEAPDLSSYNLCNSLEKLQAELNEGLYTASNAEDQVALTTAYYARRKLAVEGLDTYWLSKPLRVGVGQKHNISVELGNPQGLKAMLDVSYNDVAGVMKGSDRKSIQGNANIAYRTKKLLFRNIMSVISNKSAESPYGTFSDYTKMNPFWKATDAEGNVYRYAEGSAGYQSSYGGSLTQVANPLYDATIGTSITSSYLKFTNNFYAEWQIVDALKAVGRVGVSQQRNDADSFYPANHSMFNSYTESDLLLRGKYILENGKSNALSGDLNFNYNQSFGKHSLFANVGASLSETKYATYQHTAEGFPNSTKADITLARQYASGTTPVGISSLDREVSFLVAASYDYDNRYLVDATYRASASSLYGADNRWASSYSVGLGWNLHNEAFLRNQDLLKQFKLRASVGLTGNQNFSTNSSIATYLYYSGISYQGQTGAYLSQLPNTELKWEQKKDYNLGADIRIWKLQLTADVYRADTKNMLTDMSVPTSTGFSSVKTNLGLVRNTGVELQATLLAWQGKNGFLNIYGTFTHNKNKIIHLSESMRTYNEQMKKAAAATGNTTPVLLYEDGMAMNAIWAVQSAGIDPMTGQEVYIKRNGELTYEYSSDDLTVVGCSDPKYRGTFGFSGEWKGIGLTATFSYLAGGQMYNSTLVSRIENVDMAYNVDRRVLEGRWTTPGQVTSYKKFDSSTSTRPTSRFVQNRNELTFSSLSAYYEFPKRVTEALRMQRLRLTFYMNDITTISSIKVERGLSYPFARNMSVAITATF